jgi:opacity protein-like surface antigen
MPYLNLGLGTSWNHISQTEPQIAVQGNPVILNTDSKTTTDWNYNIGVGLDFIVVTNFWLSLGYSYDTFGHLEIGKNFFAPDILGVNPIFNTTDIGNLHAHNIIFTARYLFG